MHIPTWSEVNAAGPSACANALGELLERADLDAPAPQRDAFAAALAARLREATLADCVWAGFEFDPMDDPLRGTTTHRHCVASIAFSEPRADAPHRAVCIGWAGVPKVRAWVDGRELSVPRDHDGVPQAHHFASGWIAGRWFHIELAGLFSHPGQDPGARGQLSTQRGLLIFDAQQGRERIELPRADERWPSPTLRLDGDSLLLYPSHDAARRGSDVARHIAAAAA